MARQNPADELRELNLAAREGRLDVVEFLESNFYIPGSLFRAKPIRFESWQKESVLRPVFERRATGKDTFLNGLPKKNGKSTLSACVVADALLLDDYFPECYSAAGDMDQARVIFEQTKRAFEGGPLSRFVKIHRDVIERIDGNGFYRVLASDAPGGHGKNASAVFWDELWNQSNYDLWEALTHSPTRESPFHFITTYAGYFPHKGNLLWDLFSRGQTGDDPKQYTFWRSGPDANLASWITPEYLASQKKRLPDRIFRRLHLNEWAVADDTKVFRIPQEVWTGGFENYIPCTAPVLCYSVGIDLAKSSDYTAWTVVRKDVEPKRLVDCGRLPHMDFGEQAKLLAAICARFGNVPATVDATGVGSAVIEMLEAEGVNVEPFVFNLASKTQIVTDLQVGFEQRQLLLPKEGRTLDESRAAQDLETELFAYDSKPSATHIKFGAKSGFFDDMVTALALAWHDAVPGERAPQTTFVSLTPPEPKLVPGKPMTPEEAEAYRRWDDSFYDGSRGGTYFIH